MEISHVGDKTLSACGCCNEIFMVPHDPPNDIEAIQELLKLHRNARPACHEWYSSLPSFSDIRGIWAQQPQPLGPPAPYPTYDEWIFTVKDMLQSHPWTDEELHEIAYAMWDAQSDGDLPAAHRTIVKSWRSTIAVPPK